jgi:uncharacterized protein (TIRG00374 family)
VKKIVLLTLQSLVTLGLLAWIFSNPEARENTGVVLRNADLWWVTAAIVVAGGETFLGALRWRIFLQLLGLQVPFWQSVRLFYLGLFFNTFLVGAVGGDAVKALVLIGQGKPRSAAILSVVMDRLSGLGALVLVSCTFLLAQYGWLTQSPIVAGLIHFVFLYLVGILFVLALTFWLAASGRADKIPRWAPLRDKLTQLCGLYFLFIEKWPRTLLAAGLSCFMLLGYFLIFYCAMRAYGVQPPVTQVFAFMPVVDIISALPISLGGIGVREKLFVVLLGDLLHVSAGVAVWISLTGFLTTLFWGLIGLLTLPFYRGLLQRGQAVEAAEASHQNA